MAGSPKNLIARSLLLLAGPGLLAACQIPFQDQPTSTPAVPDLSATVAAALEETSETSENQFPATQSSNPAPAATRQTPSNAGGRWQGQWIVNIETLPAGLQMSVDQQADRLTASLTSGPDSYLIEATLLEDQRVADGTLHLNDSQLGSIRWEMKDGASIFSGYWSVPPNQGAFCGARAGEALPAECPGG